jgi:uncharacterized protein with beta-barrel porin domain
VRKHGIAVDPWWDAQQSAWMSAPSGGYFVAGICGLGWIDAHRQDSLWSSPTQLQVRATDAGALARPPWRLSAHRRIQRAGRRALLRSTARRRRPKTGLRSSRAMPRCSTSEAITCNGSAPRCRRRRRAAPANNPGGGGAEDMQQRYRAWLEGYGSVSRAGAQGTFTGDRRTTYGGIAGVAQRSSQGVSVGLSVDRSRTKVDVTSLPQSGRIDVTQVGLNGAIEHGRWALGLAGIHGIGTVRSSRFDVGGEATASYKARLWGALAELSYFVPLPGNSRLVPKLGFDWMQVRSDPFVETGGRGRFRDRADLDAVRMLAGAEVGHSWLVGRTVFDLAAYGRLVDNLVQNMGDLQVNAGERRRHAGVAFGRARKHAGRRRGRDVHGAGSRNTARLYAIYDGRFRSNSDSHSGTLGVEVRW